MPATRMTAAPRCRWVAAVGALLVTAALAWAPSAHARRAHSSHSGTGVITAISHQGGDLDLSFLFAGTPAGAFILAVPHQANLSTLDPARIGRLISLSTAGGQRVHYHVFVATPRSLFVTFHTAQPSLSLRLAPELFLWSPRQAEAIRRHRSGPVRMGFAFMSGPDQLLAARFSFTP